MGGEVENEEFTGHCLDLAFTLLTGRTWGLRAEEGHDLAYILRVSPACVLRAG